ncbi:uncharacterized protein LOC131029610 isoform X2 [Cryptomeria japonica]|uniref:uncharacterized protein LOC131029610 isoform X2 n=1 Tax=Cryptomeria japonica TaxID=3369 RepID=UPI0025ABF055|nr:uncharacterized protein LOC131029610 isoform X2 [Cryptomeria japonica]
MLQSIKISNASMAAISSNKSFFKLCQLNPRNEHSNPTNQRSSPRNKHSHPGKEFLSPRSVHLNTKNELQMPLEKEIPLISSQLFGETTSNRIICNLNGFCKPIIRFRRMPCCRVAESGAYVDKALDKEEEDEEEEKEEEEEDFVNKEQALQNTLRLVECAMFSAIVGLAYFLSSTLRIENYFGYFFSLPLVISSMRWGVAAGRKTMVSTAILLLIISGPLKAATYLLMHGSVGFAMGALWRLELNWSLSILICTMVRSIGALGFVLLTSWLLRENILALYQCGSFNEVDIRNIHKFASIKLWNICIPASCPLCYIYKAPWHQDFHVTSWMAGEGSLKSLLMHATFSAW